MVCILFFNLENSIGQEEEVWDLGVGVFPYPRHVLAGFAACGLGGLLGTCTLTGPAKWLLSQPRLNPCPSVGPVYLRARGKGREGRQALLWEGKAPGPMGPQAQSLPETASAPPLPTERPDFFA